MRCAKEQRMRFKDLFP